MMKQNHFESTCDDDLEKKKGQFLKENTAEVVTLRDWVYVWVHNILPGVVKSSTQLMYAETMERHILPRLGELSLACVSQKDVQEWVEELSVSSVSGTTGSSMSEGTVRNTLSVLSGCLRDAQKYGLIGQNPCLEPLLFMKPKEPEEERVWLKEDQLILLEPFFEEYPLGLGYHLILYAGLLLSEAVALKWENVNLNEKTIHVTQFVADLKRTENGEALYRVEPLGNRKSRSVPIPDRLHERLQLEWKTSSRTERDFVLDSGTDKPVKIDRLRAALVRKSKSLGMGKVTPQMLRDTYAMKAVHAGATSDVIAELMGFTTPQQVVKRYMTGRPGNKREVVERMFQDRR